MSTRASREDSTEEQELIERQREDTLKAARQVNSRKAQPLQLNKPVLSLGVAFVVGLGLIWMNGYAGFRAAQLSPGSPRIIAEETSSLEDLQQEVAAIENLNPEDRENLIETLQTSIEDLKTSDTLESALSTLNQAEQNLAALSDPGVDQTIQSIQRIGEQLQANGGPLTGMNEEMARGDLSALAEDIASLSTSELSLEEKEALAQKIDQIAQALENNEPGLAEELQQTAETLQSSNSSTTDEALGDLAQTIAEIGQAQSMNQAAQGAATEVEASAQTLLSQAQSGAGSQASNPGSGQGDAASGQGQGDSASGSQNGQTNSSGAGRGEGDQADGEGSIAGVDPISQGNAPGDGGETDFEQVFPAQRLGGENDLLVTIPGSRDAGGQVIGQGEASSGTSGPLSVPYYEIYPAYQQAYQKAISSGDIPLALRPLVRDYFTSLEPK